MTRATLNTRRSILAGLGGLGLVGGVAGCATASGTATGPSATAFAPRRLAPIQMSPQRIIRITVCTRPFRAAGPRLDVERIGDTKVVHNYGHGGSGWSLSWGSSAIAADKAMALAGEMGSAPTIAVIGCGALGLTSALQLQRRGARVVIYAAERTPFTRSMRATGSWTPDSRIADADKVSPDFPQLWERMARESFATHQTWLGTDGDPVMFRDQYQLAAASRPTRPASEPLKLAGPAPVRFAEYRDRIAGLAPRSVTIPVESTPFAVGSARVGSQMQFNITELARRLMEQVLAQGGRIETRLFHSPTEIAALPETIVVNCTGYGARTLWNDQTIVPVRGQIAWLAPQPEVDYGLYYDGVVVVSRADGIVVQSTRGGDMLGYGIEDETPDRVDAEATIARAATVFSPVRPPRPG